MIKGTLLLLLSVSLAGYLFCINWLKFRYRIPRIQGHHLLYKSLVAGLVFFSFSVISFAVSWPITSKSSVLYDFSKFVFMDMTSSEFRLGVIALNSILIAWLTAHIFNWNIYRKYNKLVNQVHVDRGGSSEKITSRDDSDFRCKIAYYCDEERDEQLTTAIKSIAFDNPSPVLICLDTRKSYVGIVNEAKMLQDGDSVTGITIHPLCSGYRNEDDLCLEITTFYQECIELFEMTAEEVQSLDPVEQYRLIEQLESYVISIAYSDIKTIGRFDLEKYEEFKKSEIQMKHRIKRQREELERQLNASSDMETDIVKKFIEKILK